MQRIQVERNNVNVDVILDLVVFVYPHGANVDGWLAVDVIMYRRLESENQKNQFFV